MPEASELSDEQLLQYSRQIMLPQIDVAGQQKLMNASILVLGAGGLGCPALCYLVTAGIGNIVIVDHDKVDISNMQRQILYTTQDIGQLKATVACEKLKQFTTGSTITPVTTILNEQELHEHINSADLVIDGTDNFASRYRHNKVCVASKTPLVSGAVIRFEGQVSIFDSRVKGAPCYQCLYPHAHDEQLNCSENGVLGPVAGMVGAMMATEAIKLILEIGESLVGKLMLLDALNMEWRSVKLRQDAACPTCSSD